VLTHTHAHTHTYTYHQHQAVIIILTYKDSISRHLNPERQIAGKSITNKLTPYGTDGRLFATDVSAKFKDT